ncbi:MAG: hypothetical protein KIC60_00880 [Clostridium sp.]|nr:hypothetical protein [Clostridium sp.]
MKKILTAINNPNLNKKLSDQEFIEIPYKDIQYKEAILEILNKDNYFDIIIINEQLPGEINFIELIKKIKKINKKIKIIIILEKENEIKESELKKININEIYYNNKITLEYLIKIIKEKEINKEEELKKEINELKQIIKMNEIKNIKNMPNNNKKFFSKNKIFYYKELFKKPILLIKNIKYKQKEINIKEICKGRVINVVGYKASGKSVITLMLAKVLSDKNYRILIINFSSEEINFYSYMFNYSKGDTKKFYIKKKHFYRKSKSINFQKSNKINIKNLKLKKEILKNKIYKFKNFYNIEKNINNILKNYNKNIKILNINKLNKNYFEIKYLNKIIKYLKNNFNYIFLEINYEEKIKKEIIKIIDKNLIILEPNKIGILRAEKIIKELNIIETEKINIIINKNNKNSINKEIINTYFYNYKILTIINNNTVFERMINNKMILKNNLIYLKLKKMIKNW